MRKLVSRWMGEVLVKLQYYNPTGPYKDRMALAMIEGAEARGEVRPACASSNGQVGVPDRRWRWVRDSLHADLFGRIFGRKAPDERLFDGGQVSFRAWRKMSKRKGT